MQSRKKWGDYLVDELTMIYEAFIENPFIYDNAFGRIKYYEYPETGEVNKPYVVIDPLDAPLPSVYADDKWLTHDYMVQIDVWTKERQITRQLSTEIAQTMWNLNFGQYGGGTNEWDKATGIYREARRYRGKIYREIIKGEK